MGYGTYLLKNTVYRNKLLSIFQKYNDKKIRILYKTLKSGLKDISKLGLYFIYAIKE